MGEMSKLDDLIERMKAAAAEMLTMNEFGALHIFVADGNFDDGDLEFCLVQPEITAAEREFCSRMLQDFTREQRGGVYAFAEVMG
jgi:hypothetical protein